MKLTIKMQKVILELICLLYILLFVYAAVSKLMDFENFQVELGQSPLLSAFAGWVSWVVPISELIIALLLVFPRFRLIGLFAAFSLMVMFTTYIIIILNFSSFVPCSCGGILEEMGWTEHLLFNIVFILLALLGLFLGSKQSNNWMQRMELLPKVATILLTLLFSVGSMTVLYIFSEEIMHHENPFLRLYPQHPIILNHTTNLGFNSYYFSGHLNNRIYLGNYTDPLNVISMDTTLQDRQVSKIILDQGNIPFRMAQVIIRAPYFYIMDGTVPCVFQGKVSDWKANTKLQGSPYFTLALPVDSTTILFRSNNGKKASHIIGIFGSERFSKIQYSSDLLQQQVDGIFDTDGMLQYSEKSRKMVYVYYYRNEFIVANSDAKLDYRGHTIDTNAHAKIKVSYLKNGTERRMSAPPLVVNAHTAIANHHLFVHSKVPGRFENDRLWEQASIIDVYDLNKKTYVLSFAIYNKYNSKLQSFFVTSTHLYALIGNHLEIYELQNSLLKLMNAGTIKGVDS